MPSCIVAFHVTCAFDHGLEMRTILAENDEVRFKSFCLEHSSSTNNSSHNSGLNGTHSGAKPDWVTSTTKGLQLHQPNSSADPEQRSVACPISASERAERDQLEREKVSQRKQKLQELEDEFYQLVDPKEVAENLALPLPQVQHSTLFLCFVCAVGCL